MLNTLDNRSETLVTAEALAKNPASVIPTCIVDKNSLGYEINLVSNSAFLLPSSASLLILLLFNDTISISEAAKKALIKTSIKISKNNYDNI